MLLVDVHHFEVDGLTCLWVMAVAHPGPLESCVGVPQGGLEPWFFCASG